MTTEERLTALTGGCIGVFILVAGAWLGRRLVPVLDKPPAPYDQAATITTNLTTMRGNR